MPSVRPRTSWLPRGRLVPDAVVHPLGLLGQPAGQGDDLADHQLHDAAGVGVRRVEDRDAALGRRRQVDLVGADAEAADRQQVGRGVEHLLGDVVLERIPSRSTPVQGLRRARPRTATPCAARPRTRGPRALDGDGMDVLEQQRLHVAQPRRDPRPHRFGDATWTPYFADPSCVVAVRTPTRRLWSRWNVRPVACCALGAPSPVASLSTADGRQQADGSAPRA